MPATGAAARPARGYRVCAAGEVGRWFETVIAFACLCLWGIETAVAFAGGKWAFLVQFLGAEVMPVSVVPCWGRAVVSGVSMSPCLCVLCAKFFALHVPGVGASAKKFALRRKNGSKWAFLGEQGELFRGDAAGGGVLGEFFARPGAAQTVCLRGPGVYACVCVCRKL